MFSGVRLVRFYWKILSNDRRNKKFILNNGNSRSGIKFADIFVYTHYTLYIEIFKFGKLLIGRMRLSTKRIVVGKLSEWVSQMDGKNAHASAMW